MGRFQEEQCGKIVREGLPQTKKDLNVINQSGHLLSCGGAYVSQSSFQGIQKIEVRFLSLPRRTSSALVLKNFQIQEEIESVESEDSCLNEREDKAPQFRKRKINPDQIH